MSKNKYHREHALHNEKVCNHLNDQTHFYDWIITTAFYASLHYIKYKIFPFKFVLNNKPVVAQTFDIYCIRCNKRSGKHAILSSLVEKHHSNIAVAYNKLKDLSWTARYNDYQYDKDVSDEALYLLKEIKEYCS